MGQGVDAVRNEIAGQFDLSSDINERYDVDSMSTALSFKAEDRLFVVFISTEFDEDYPSGLLTDLAQLGDILRASKTGRATVRNSGISAS
jgi:hypothetical protein